MLVYKIDYSQVPVSIGGDELFMSLLYRDHLDLLERNNQFILELRHLDSTPAQRYIQPYVILIEPHIL